MTRRLLLLPAVGAIALAAAACGTSDSSTDSAAATAAADTAASGDTAAAGDTAASSDTAAAPAQDEVKKGGRLKVMVEEDYDYWDGTSYYGAQWSVGYITCNGLLDPPNSADLKEQGTLVGGIAEDMPEISEDGTTFTFKIREGLKFSDGKPVTPEDVKDTYERNLDPKSGFTDGSLGSGYYNGIVGFDEHQKNSKGISGIKIDGQNVVFTLKSADPAFQFATSLRFMCIVPKGTPHKHTPLPPPNTGPYSLTAYTPKRSAKLDRNPVWESTNKAIIGEAPNENNIDGIDFQLSVPADQQLLKIRNNEADYSMDGTAVSGSAVAETARDASLKDRYKSYDDSAITYMFLNTTVAPFDNVKLRQAVNYAIDRETLVKVAGGKEARAAWSQVVPSTMLAEGVEPEVYPASADVEKAKALVQESGVATPVAFTYAFITNPANDAIAQALKNQLEQVGFKVTLKPTPGSSYYQLVSDAANKVQAGFAGWGQDFADPITFFAPLLKGGSGSNYAQFKEPKVDAEIARITAMPLGDERQKAWSELSTTVARDYAPWAVYHNRRYPNLNSERVGNFIWSPVAKQIYYGSLYLKDAS